jgi:hypothetical protein
MVLPNESEVSMVRLQDDPETAPKIVAGATTEDLLIERGDPERNRHAGDTENCVWAVPPEG